MHGSSSSATGSWTVLPRLEKAIVAALAVFALLLSALLLPAWLHNPDDTHGLFMPLVFVLLAWQGSRTGVRRFLKGGPGLAAAQVALAAAGVCGLAVSGLYAAAVDWSNALVQFLLAGSLTLLLGSALAVLADRRVRFLPLNWPTFCAVALWPLSAPIPPGTYTRISNALQLWISSGVLDALHLLGVVATRQGNVIRLADTAVGVEDACSGVRSLVSCVFVGVFLSASLVRKPAARAAIVLLAAPLALGMNFVRSLTLTLLANGGTDIRRGWHDATGYAVLAVTAALLGGLALLLESGRTSEAPESPAPAEAEPGPRSAAGPRFLGAALAASAALIALFLANTRAAGRSDAAAPNLLAIIPESADGWTVTTNNDLYRFSDVLQTDCLAQRTYRRGATQVTIYVAYWKPGQAPVSLVATHTPDACWPGSGWIAQPLPESRVSLPEDGAPLPEAECRLFVNSGAPQYVWFWHLYDGRPIPYLNPYSLRQLLHIALLYGFRHDGDQVFIRVSSNRPWEAFADEPFMREFLSRLAPLGLRPQMDVGADSFPFPSRSHAKPEEGAKFELLSSSAEVRKHRSFRGLIEAFYLRPLLRLGVRQGSKRGRMNQPWTGRIRSEIGD